MRKLVVENRPASDQKLPQSDIADAGFAIS